MRSGDFTRLGASAVIAALLTFTAATACDIESPAMREHMQHRPQHQPMAPASRTPCVGGMAGIYPCSNIDLLAFVPVSQFQATTTNSLWGWTDPDSGTEYALIGANNGIAFYDLSTPAQPRYLGKLPTSAGSSIWRDVRVYQNHAFVVSDANPGHGLQVFDLTRLRTVTSPQTFTEDGHYSGFGSSHTISINETTGYASVAGADIVCPGDSDHGGLQILDIHNPTSPTFAGCINDAGYTHESQCYVYSGPDSEHAGRDLCFDSNGSSGRIAIVDVTDKANPVTLSSTPYNGSAYTHQSWLTEDQHYLLLDDELDEEDTGNNARTYIFDVSDLDAPVLVGFHEHPLTVIDHNLYVHGNYVYQSDYEAGVRILRIDDLAATDMTEVAYFDTYPASNNAAFNGTWNNFRFPGSGNIIATGIDEGFFVLEPHICEAPVTPGNLVASPNGDHRIDLAWDASPTPGTTYNVERAQGGCGGNFRTIADRLTAATYSDTTASGQVNYGYRVTAGITGPLSHPNTIVSSEPALPQADVVSLILTGSLSTTDQSTSVLAQSGLGTAASLLTDALINAPVSRASNKLFGLSRLEISPVIAGNGSTPTARLTVARRISKDVTVTYSTNLASDPNQILAVEYRVSNRLSFVAQYEQGSLRNLSTHSNNYSFEIRFRKRF